MVKFLCLLLGSVEMHVAPISSGTVMLLGWKWAGAATAMSIMKGGAGEWALRVESTRPVGRQSEALANKPWDKGDGGSQHRPQLHLGGTCLQRRREPTGIEACSRMAQCMWEAQTGADCGHPSNWYSSNACSVFTRREADYSDGAREQVVGGGPGLPTINWTIKPKARS